MTFSPRIGKHRVPGASQRPGAHRLGHKAVWLCLASCPSRCPRPAVHTAAWASLRLWLSASSLGLTGSSLRHLQALDQGGKRHQGAGIWNSYEDEVQGVRRLFSGLRIREPDTGFSQNLPSQRNLLFPSPFPSSGSGTTAPSLLCFE